MTEQVAALLRELRACGETLPASLRDRIVAEGAPLIPPLIDVLLEEETDEAEDDDNDGDWSSIHAVDLLVDLGAEAAVGPMLRVLEETGWDYIIHDRIAVRLPELGAPVLEPALAVLAELPAEDVAESLCAIISRLGVRDERVFQHLVARFEVDAVLASIWLADYGDERGIPLIEREILNFDVGDEQEHGHFWLRDLTESYERLAGPLPDHLRSHVEELRAQWQAARSPAPPVVASSPKIGRNDPCPCGSGKKYKRCHLGSDST